MGSNGGSVIGFTVLSTMAFAASVVISFIPSIPNNGIFNNTMRNLSEKYPTDVSPADYTFSIWGLIYLFQFAWIAYAFSCMCRSNKDGMVLLNPVVLPVKFHVAWIGTCIVVVLWVFYFFAEQLMIAAACLVSVTLLSFTALLINAVATARNEKRLAPNDLICIRVLIQNGVDLYHTWCIFATLVSVSMALTYDPNMPRNLSQEDSGTLCLCALGVIIIGWSFLENTKLFRYFKYIYSGYFVLVWGLIGIIVQNPDVSKKNTIITITLLCLSVVALAAKITVFCLAPSTSYRKVKKYKLLEE